MIKKRISKLRDRFKDFDIDGYVIPKNDEFFSEYSQKDRLKTISNAGHWLHAENPEAFFTTVFEFLS